MSTRVLVCAQQCSVLGVLALGLPAWAEEPPLSKYLVDLSGGPVAAHEILGLSGTAVTQVQSPKDIAVALGNASGSSGQTGFGLAVTPARLSWGRVAVSAADYANDGNWGLKRLWGNTTFSYAQGEKDINKVSYKRWAVAVQASVYLNRDDDPVVAARQAFLDECLSLSPQPPITPLFNAQEKVAVAIQRGLDNKRAERNGADPSPEERRQVQESAKAAVAFEEVEKSAAGTFACVKKAADAAKPKWNASQLSLGVGQGWLRGPDGGSRISLGRQLVLNLSLGGPKYGMPDALVQVTWRRTSGAVDTGTLVSGPVYRSANLAALRYTQGFGPGANTFVLAEISNAKAARLTEVNAAFKSALGVDHRLSDNLWLEFRYGRSRTQNGTGTENKGLLNLKFSPASTLNSKS